MSVSINNKYFPQNFKDSFSATNITAQMTSSKQQRTAAVGETAISHLVTFALGKVYNKKCFTPEALQMVLQHEAMEKIILTGPAFEKNLSGPFINPRFVNAPPGTFCVVF